MDPEWIPIWIPTWTLHGSSYMDPCMDPCMDPTWITKRTRGRRNRTTVAQRHYRSPGGVENRPFLRAARCARRGHPARRGARGAVTRHDGDTYKQIIFCIVSLNGHASGHVWVPIVFSAGLHLRGGQASGTSNGCGAAMAPTHDEGNRKVPHDWGGGGQATASSRVPGTNRGAGSDGRSSRHLCINSTGNRWGGISRVIVALRRLP